MSSKLRGRYVGALIATSLAILAAEAQSEPKARATRTGKPVSAKVSQVASKSSTRKHTLQTTSISTTSNGTSDSISIPTLAQTPRYNVSRLESPARLVVDIESSTLQQQSPIATKQLSHVSAVRVGNHGKNSRVVIDLRDGNDVEFATSGRGGLIVLSLAKRGSSRESSAPRLEQAKAASVNSSSKVLIAQGPKTQKASTLMLDEEVVASGGTNSATKPAVQKPVLPDAGAENPDRSPKVVPVSASDVDLTPKGVKADLDLKKTAARQKSAEESQGFVSGVSLQNSKGMGPSVVVGVTGASEFALNRTAPSEYVLTLKDAKASDLLKKQTLFSSGEEGGIRSVRTTTEGSNTLVRVFADSSSYLTARRSGDSVIIEETQDLTRIARDIRAQMSPDKQAKDAAADESAVAKAAAKDVPVKPEAEKKAPKEAPKDSKAAKELPAATTSASEKATQQKDLKQDSGKEASPAKSLNVEPQQSSDQKAEGDRAAIPSNDKELKALRENSGNYTGRLISLDLQDADIDSALRIIAEVSNLNIVAGDGVAGKVTLKLVDVPWDQALDVILKSHGLDKVVEGNVMRVASMDKLRAERESLKQARVAEEELESLGVKYMRVSYAKASEIKALVETVLSERGNVAFDERSNQLIVKDVKKGLQNVSELVKKIDLRTPQILLETQIVEAKRDLTRQLGAELGFQYIQSPATGNGTGLNFPSSIAVGGSVDPATPGSILGSAFPVAISNTAGSAVTMLFDSADGTRNLQLRLSQLEEQGDVRVISKPAVATTNNKPAEIKSVTKIRVKLPNGGLSIATGSGAQSSGSGDIATQTIEAGIVLNVTPQASPDYYILLDIKAKSSTFGKNGPDGIPEEIERSASSSVLVSSGQTFALGGIYKISQSDSVSGVPFFKDIPFLGTFFRSSTMRGSDEELLFFITPRIVEGSFEDASLRVGAES